MSDFVRWLWNTGLRSFRSWKAQQLEQLQTAEREKRRLHSVDMIRRAAGLRVEPLRAKAALDGWVDKAIGLSFSELNLARTTLGIMPSSPMTWDGNMSCCGGAPKRRCWVCGCIRSDMCTAHAEYWKRQADAAQETEDAVKTRLGDVLDHAFGEHDRN